MRNIIVFSAIISVALMSGAHAQPDSGRPQTAFSGCDAVEAEFRKSQERSDSAPIRKVDPITKREFAASSTAQIESLGLANGLNCWARIDGLWREDVPVALDESIKPDGWESFSPSLENLATSVYTTPRFLFIDVFDRGEELSVNFGPAFDHTARYRSIDETALSDVLRRDGAVKRYQAVGRGGDRFGTPDLIVDVTRTGYARISIDGVSFLRPRPGVSRNDWSEQISDRDPFMIGFTVENLTANRRGYDVVFQDPDRFLNNPKAEVFRRVSRGYAIDEKRIIPLGMKIVKEDVQGMVHYTAATSSEREFQKMNRSAYGEKIAFGLQTDIGDVGLSSGANIAREKFSSLKQSNYVAEENGYMRFKKYALITDHAYTQLSDAFIDAIEDARVSGDYYAIIEKFGTHYPYAVTYGAAGKVTQYISREGFFRASGRGKEKGRTGAASLGLINAEVFTSRGAQTSSSTAVSDEYGERVFTAVGGNGSWNESGFSAGEAQYPILADLRPLSDLLSPIYFADEPEIYRRVKYEFADAIAEYLYQYAALSEESLLPDLSEYIAIEGCWAFRDGKGNQYRNMISFHGDNTIIARRRGDPDAFLYIEESPNLFRAEIGASTYEFLGDDTAIWQSNDGNRVIYRMRLVGETC
ncbi:MAC/perforin domain-containing protein [Hyphococcus sp.]|uniref:MAC/perforin domain-containing protein n=1 Tax=Hyphococcus sp. TaxID=2038636 RepID=UPI002089F1D0|nr:MAG: hypothetical protein DHS20C04_17940 [Marinicaulis sp.]